MTTTSDYQGSGRAMMAQSRDELERGDLQQASEKGWGATAQMMKAIAESRGWEHGRHRHQIARRLRAQVGDRDMYYLFNTASALHENFYENQMTVLSNDIWLPSHATNSKSSSGRPS